MPFLHGVLDVEVYMRHPLWYSSSVAPGHECLLKKSLYGLRQVPRAWYSMLSKFLLDHGFVQSKADSSLFIQKTTSHLVLVLVYVDDLIITWSDSVIINSVIHNMSTAFAMKDLGNLHYFLGVEVHRRNFLNSNQVCLGSFGQGRHGWM